MFDPSGEFFFDGILKSKPEGDEQESETSKSASRTLTSKRPSARNYGLNPNFLKQFPDQFEPFLSLPFGVKESFFSNNDETSSKETTFRGTIFRLPLRTSRMPESNICSRVFDMDSISKMIETLSEKIPSTFLFTYNLQYIGIYEWMEKSNEPDPLLHSRISSSPIIRIKHRDDMEENTEWMQETPKLTKLFKNEWTPLQSSFTLQISTRRKKDEFEIVDTFLIRSVLGPGRLRAMACTDALKPLKLIPIISLAAHIHRKNSTNLEDIHDTTRNKGTLFAGLDTSIKLGLPFLMNVPTFLHEMNGSILLNKEDDKKLREKFPSIRNIQIHNKHGNRKEMRTIALYMWNRETISCAASLIPYLLQDIRNKIHSHVHHDPRKLYSLWPFYNNIRSKYKELVPRSIYDELGNPMKKIYLTVNGNFKGINEGYFTSPKYPIPSGAAKFFQKELDMFNVPQRVIEDLECFFFKGFNNYFYQK